MKTKTMKMKFYNGQIEHTEVIPCFFWKDQEFVGHWNYFKNAKYPPAREFVISHFKTGLRLDAQTRKTEAISCAKHFLESRHTKESFEDHLKTLEVLN
jgi:hypothetical protein